MRRLHAQCEDEDDASRMAQTILRDLGFANLAVGPNVHDVNADIGAQALLNIARNAERISRWAREELKRKVKA